MFQKKFWQFLPAFGLTALGLGLLTSTIVQANSDNSKSQNSFAIINHFSLTNSQFSFAPANMPQGLNWGGKLLMTDNNQSATTELTEYDGIQYFRVSDRLNSNRYCIISSSTEFGDNTLGVYKQQNLNCHINSQFISKEAGQSFYEDAVEIV